MQWICFCPFFFFACTKEVFVICKYNWNCDPGNNSGPTISTITLDSNKVDRCLARYSPRAQTDLPNQLISEPVIGHICAEMVPNWKTERNQSCLRIWGSYDPIECSPSEPQKWVLQGVAWKKTVFRVNFGPKMDPAAPQRPAMQWVNTKLLSFWCPVTMGTIFLDDVSEEWVFGRKTAFMTRKRTETYTY